MKMLVCKKGLTLMRYIKTNSEFSWFANETSLIGDIVETVETLLLVICFVKETLLYKQMIQVLTHLVAV